MKPQAAMRLITVKQPDDDQPRRDGSSAVALLNLRLLAGRFHEGWTLVRERWPAIAPLYAARLSTAECEALAALYQHFDVAKADNIVFMIRNKIGFHADHGFAAKMLAAAPDDLVMTEYPSASRIDILQGGCERIHYQALQAITGCSADEAAFGAVMDELIILQNLFLRFIGGFVRLFAQTHLAREYGQVRAHRHRLTKLPAFEAQQIRFFVDISASRAATETPAED